MTHLYLIRHGEAVSNVEPIIGGMRGDSGLTARGIEQAERLRDRLASSGEINADVLIASTLPRARQTAEIIRSALGLPIIWDEDVQELRPGEADGLSVEEFRQRFGEPAFDHDPFQPLAPGGESWAGFMLRVATTLNRIARAHEDQTVVIVCHGGVIDVAFQSFFGLGLAFLTVRFRTKNTSLTHWEWRAEEHGVPHWSLHAYNDIAHLRDMDGSAPPSDEPEERPDHATVPLPTDESRDA